MSVKSPTTCHCGAKSRDDGSDYSGVCEAWPICEKQVRRAEVFGLVKHPGNWKMPFAAIVDKSAATEEEISDAVVWFAGGAPEIEDLGDSWRVTGAGYYTWVGA